MFLIGISGKIGTGKTTLAEHLCGELDGVRMSFADALRREVHVSYGVPMELMLTRAGKDTTVADGRTTVRELLQMHGVFRREDDPDYWVRQLDAKIQDVENVIKTVIVDDVRFANEAAMIYRKGFLIRLEPFPGWTPGPNAGHISETALDNWSFWDLRIRPPFGELQRLAHLVASWAVAKWSATDLWRQIQGLDPAA